MVRDLVAVKLNYRPGIALISQALQNTKYAAIIMYCFVSLLTFRSGTLTHGHLKVHGGVLIVLCIFVDPL